MDGMDGWMDSWMVFLEMVERYGSLGWLKMQVQDLQGVERVGREVSVFT